MNLLVKACALSLFSVFVSGCASDQHMACCPCDQAVLSVGMEATPFFEKLRASGVHAEEHKGAVDPGEGFMLFQCGPVRGNMLTVKCRRDSMVVDSMFWDTSYARDFGKPKAYREYQGVRVYKVVESDFAE